MKVSFIRHNVSQHVTLSPNGTEQTTFSCAGFDYVILGTTSWASGSRNRSKSFGTLKDQTCFNRLRAYFNKLHAGGYLSDMDYSLAWQASLDLEATVACGRSHTPHSVVMINVDNTTLDMVNGGIQDLEDHDLSMVLKKQAA